MFATKLANWYHENRRFLPWRDTHDAYRIWLSEIILQQTRIEQGLDYYLRFIEDYPSVFDLAKATEQQVLKSWQGLGYYSRARNLHFAAQQIVNQFGGSFPQTPEGLMQLKGVGRYTAAAIASFAFRVPVPVIDGNVYRFISRYYGIFTPIGTVTAYKEFESILLKVIDCDHPDDFNQALMDFGSLWCKPSAPRCDDCPFRDSCEASRSGKVDLLPVKYVHTKVKRRFFYYMDADILDADGCHRTWMQQRTGADIWKGLYEFPLIETDHRLSDTQLKKKSIEWLLLQTGCEVEDMVFSEAFVHQLTHRTIEARFARLKIYGHPFKNPENALIFHRSEVYSLPISRLIDKYLSQL